NYLVFTETDPVTLAYMGGGDQLTAASLPAQAFDRLLDAETARSLLTEALPRWQAAGKEMSFLGAINIRVANVGGMTHGLADEFHHVIWLDDNAARSEWFVDPKLWGLGSSLQ